MEDYIQWIGKKVWKKGLHKDSKKDKQPKPFKSRLLKNTVKGVINHPQLNKPAFIFEEDDSYVSCETCSLTL